MNGIINALATLLGVTPDQIVGLGYAAIMAPVTFAVTQWVRGLLAKMSWLTTTMSEKVVGVVMVVVSAAVAVVMVLVTGWLFGIDYLSTESTFTGILLALGISQTGATAIFHILKKPSPVVAHRAAPTGPGTYDKE